MPRRGAVAVVLTTLALILLLNFKTPDASPVSRVALGGGGTPEESTPPILGGTPDPTSRPGTSPSPRTTSGTAAQTITGPVIDTRYGPVQIEATVRGGRIVDVQALQLPTDRPLSARISQYVAPILRSEAIQTQSPQIDFISGATYTSEGYAESLQAILDQAHG